MKIRVYAEGDLEAVVALFTAAIHTLAADAYDAAQRAV